MKTGTVLYTFLLGTCIFLYSYFDTLRFKVTNKIIHEGYTAQIPVETNEENGNLGYQLAIKSYFHKI